MIKAQSTIKAELISASGCKACADARDRLKAIVDELGPEHVSWREVDILEELDYVVELGVLSPPAIAIDGELVFPALPTPERLRAELIRRLEIQQ